MNVLLHSDSSRLMLQRDFTEIASDSCVYSGGRLLVRQTVEALNCLAPRPDATEVEQLLASIGNDLRLFHRCSSGQEFRQEKIIWDVNKKIIRLAALLRNEMPNVQNPLRRFRNKISLSPQTKLLVGSWCIVPLFPFLYPEGTVLKYRDGLCVETLGPSRQGAPAITFYCGFDVGIHTSAGTLQRIDKRRMELQLNELPETVEQLERADDREGEVYKAMYHFASHVIRLESGGHDVRHAADRLRDAARECLFSHPKLPTSKRCEEYFCIKGAITVGAKTVAYHYGNLLTTYLRHLPARRM